MLPDIVASVEQRLPQVIARMDEYKATVTSRRRSFADALASPGVSVIAEIKRRSPSRGVLNAGLDPARQARAYEAGGAASISVLTERDHFSGSADDLREVRTAIRLPVLRKDFIIHPAQVWESLAMGADAILLIVAILDDATLGDLYREASDVGIPVLVETHTEQEVERAGLLGAEIIGVNNRDLATFDVDLATAERLAPLIGSSVLKVAESGIHTPSDAGRMLAAGFDAVLVGESLVKAADPGRLVSEISAVAP